MKSRGASDSSYRQMYRYKTNRKHRDYPRFIHPRILIPKSIENLGQRTGPLACPLAQ